MTSMLSWQLRPKNFTRGRLAAILCGIYLTLVLAAWLFAIASVYFSDPSEGASLGGVYLIVLTSPLSFALIPLTDMLGLLDPTGLFGEILLWSLMLLPGLTQAGIGWLVIRGRRIVRPHNVEATPG